MTVPGRPQPAAVVALDATTFLLLAHYAGPDRVGTTAQPVAALQRLHDQLAALHEQHPDAAYRFCVFEAATPGLAIVSAAAADAFAAQLAPARTLAAAMGWTVLDTPPSGALDMLATICAGATGKTLPVVVVGPRKQLAQLVGPGASWRDPITGKCYDVAAIHDQFGVAPQLVPDYLALVGDLADGIEGVPRVGPKRARAALREYGSARDIVERADTLAGSEHELLINHVDALAMRLERLQLRPANIALDVLVASAHAVAGPADDVASLTRQLGLATGTPATQAARTVTSAATAVDMIRTEAQLHELCDRLAGQTVSIAVATDTLAPMRARLVGVALSPAAGQGAYIPLAHADGTLQLDTAAVLRQLRPWLQDPGQPKVIADARLALHAFANHGTAVGGIDADPQLQLHVLLGTEPLPLGVAAERLLRRPDVRSSAHAVVPDGSTRPAHGSEPIGRSLAEAADIAGQLARVLTHKLSAIAALAEFNDLIEQPTTRILKDIERHGMLVDTDYLRRLTLEFEQTRELLKAQAWHDAGRQFDLDDATAVAAVLYDHLGLTAPPAPEGRRRQPAAPRPVDRDTLARLERQSPVPGLITQFQHLGDLLRYTKTRLPRAVEPTTGRIHTRFELARTGRIISKDPSLHNIPVRSPQGRRIREAFVAPPGHVLVATDYSQIELRILAHFSGDPILSAAFAAGLDVHRATAAELFGIDPAHATDAQRRFAKAINFGLIYGKHTRTLALQTGVSRQEAEQFVARYFERFRGVKQYIEDVRARARQDGYVETLFGRRIAIPDIRHRDFAKRTSALNQAVNAPMQGTVADLMKVAMLAIDDWLDRELMTTRLIMQVHDELLFEAPEEELPDILHHIPRLMQTDRMMNVPITVETGYGPNWASAH